MSDWQRTTLGKVTTQVSRAVRVEDLTEARYAGVRWYVGGVYHRETVPAEKIKGKLLYRIKRDDIVYNRMWATKASFGVVKDDADGCYVTNDFPVLTVNPRVILPAYVEAIFHAASFQSEAAGRAVGTTERRRLHVRDFASIPVVLPPLPMQERIVEVIGAVDDQISALDIEAEAVDRLSMAVAADLLANEPIVALGTTLDDIRGGRSPQANTRPPGADEIGVLKVSAVTPFRFVPEESKALLPGTSMPKSALVQPGDVLITRANTPSRVGAVARVPADVRDGLYLADKTLRLVPSSKLDPDFLVVAMALKSARRHLTSSATGTSASMFNVSQDRIRETPIPLPDLERQQEVSSAVLAVRANADAARAEVASLRRARAGLLSGLLDRTIDIESAESEV